MKALIERSAYMWRGPAELAALGVEPLSAHERAAIAELLGFLGRFQNENEVLEASDADRERLLGFYEARGGACGLPGPWTRIVIGKARGFEAGLARPAGNWIADQFRSRGI